MLLFQQQYKGTQHTKHIHNGKNKEYINIKHEYKTKVNPIIKMCVGHTVCHSRETQIVRLNSNPVASLVGKVQ